MKILNQELFKQDRLWICRLNMFKRCILLRSNNLKNIAKQIKTNISYLITNYLWRNNKSK